MDGLFHGKGPIKMDELGVPLFLDTPQKAQQEKKHTAFLLHIFPAHFLAWKGQYLSLHIGQPPTGFFRNHQSNGEFFHPSISWRSLLVSVHPAELALDRSQPESS